MVVRDVLSGERVEKMVKEVGRVVKEERIFIRKVYL